MTDAQITQLLADFIDGKNRSITAAGQIEVAIDDRFPDDEEVADVVLALASYRPGGGDYLYDEQAIVRQCKWLQEKIASSA